MEKDMKSLSSGKRLTKPSELNLSSTEQSSRLSSGTVYSPVTELSMNLGDLSTDTGVSGFSFIKRIGSQRLDDTPKRKISIFSPVPLKQLSFNSGSSDESPASVRTTKPPKFGTLLKDSNSSEGLYKRSECRSSAYARFKAMPSPFCAFGSSPSVTCPPESLEDKENASPAKALFKDYDRIQCSSPLREKKLFSLAADDTNSQDSGVCLELTSKSLDGFKFPIAPAPRRHRIFSDETANSPLKYSPVKDSPTFKGKLSLSSPAPSPKSSSLTISPVKLRRSSLTFSPENDEGDEGFLELKDDDDAVEFASAAPSGLDKLINAPVLNNSITSDSDESSPIKQKCVRRLQTDLDGSFEIRQKPASIKRGLFRSPSDPSGGFHRSKSFAYGASPGLGSNNSAFSPVCCSPMFSLNKKPTSPRAGRSKRSEPCTDEEFTPLRLCKRRKSVIETPKESSPVKPRFQRSHSEAEIKHAVNIAASQPDLIGDCSKEYCLPTVSGDHADLKSISHETMSKLLRGEYDHVVEKYVIVDARYPYEYSGGHIEGAKSIYKKDDLLKTFLESDEHKNYQLKDSSKRQILIFHCEFSQNRGPNNARFLRKHDRKVSDYPSLHYPEIYLLHKGYKEFYYNQKAHCEPQTYCPMLHQNHSDDLKKFRAKSKSWAGDSRSRHGLRTGLKF